MVFNRERVTIHALDGVSYTLILWGLHFGEMCGRNCRELGGLGRFEEREGGRNS